MKAMFDLKMAEGTEWSRLAPGQGEDIGNFLERAADDRAKHLDEKNPMWRRSFSCWEVFQIYHLAARAYDYGASASIGHKRTERYLLAKIRCEKKAEEIAAEYERVKADT